MISKTRRRRRDNSGSVAAACGAGDTPVLCPLGQVRKHKHTHTHAGIPMQDAVFRLLHVPARGREGGGMSQGVELISWPRRGGHFRASRHHRGHVHLGDVRAKQSMRCCGCPDPTGLCDACVVLDCPAPRWRPLIRGMPRTKQQTSDTTHGSLHHNAATHPPSHRPQRRVEQRTMHAYSSQHTLPAPRIDTH